MPNFGVTPVMSSRVFITYSSPQEKDALLQYAKALDNKRVEEIIQGDGVRSPEDARELSSFFWKMVDQTVIDSGKNVEIAGYTSLKSLCEDVMQSLRSHFITTGYMEIWEDESDKV